MLEDKAWLDNVLRVLRERGVSGDVCPRCGTDDWFGERTGVMVTDLPLTTLSVPPRYNPVLVLTCRNCGYTIFHNLKILGLEP